MPIQKKVCFAFADATMMKNRCPSILAAGILVATLSGCQSLSYTDQGVLAGGATGAGVGALVGDATGNAGTGAIIGAGIGALSGGLIGNGLDEVEARNRAQIAAQMGRAIPVGGVQVQDVLGMAAAGVDEELIVNHIRANGMMRPLQAQEVIALQQQGVSKPIIATLQTTPVVQPQPQMIAGPPPGAVMVPQPVYAAPPPWYYPPPHFHAGCYPRRPRSSFGVSFSN